MRHRIAAALAAGVLAVAGGFVTSGVAHADTTICEKFGSTTIQGGRYVVQNNNWGDDTTQCINVTATGFSITQASHNKPTNGAPGSYPSVFYGCHYANCSSGSGLPTLATAAAMSNLSTSVSMTQPNSGVWDAAYDIWFDPTARTDGQNTGAEIMVWLNKLGSIQPVGSQVGTANIAGATWNVWEGNIGWNVVSYVRQTGTTSLSFNVDQFYGDAVSRGFAQRSWYLTSIQAGFEPWVGQTGLAVNTFSVTSGGGGGGDTQAPTTPGTPQATGTTSSSVSLNWGASSDNIGVTSYEIFRATGSGPFTLAGTAASPPFTSSGLSASTQYRFYVRARDAANNISANSGILTVTTQGGGGGGGACRVRWVPNTWNNGFTADLTLTNTGSAAINGWALAWSFAGNQQVTSAWNATLSQSGQSVTARNLSYNGNLAPGASTGFGFQGTYSGTNATPTGFTVNGSACTIG